MSSSTSFGSGVFSNGPLGSAPFYSVKELIDAVLTATSHASPADYTTERAAILQFINNFYQQICLGQFWRWMHASYDFQLQAPYSDGTALATQGQDLVTGIGTVWNSTLSPKNIFFFNAASEVYHVSEVTSDSTLVLETAFSEDTISTGQGYTCAKNQYKLPKETDHIKSLIVDSQVRVRFVGPEDFRFIQSRDPTRLGRPEIATLIRRDTDDDAIYMEVYPAPDRFYQCHIDYSVRIFKLEDSTDCYPIIPDRYRAVLYYGALSEFYRFLKDPVNQASARADYDKMIMQMRNDRQLTDQDLVIIPARNYRGRRQPYSFPVTMSIEDFGKLD